MLCLPLRRFHSFLVVTVFAICSSCEVSHTICDKKACQLLVQSGSFVRIDDGVWPYWYRFDGRSLQKLDGMYPGSSPLVYNEKLDITAAKSLSGEGVRLTLYRGGKGTLEQIRTHNFQTDEIIALCITDSGSVWMVHAGYPEGLMPRQYILSRGTLFLEGWRNYFLTSDGARDTFDGNVIERPVSLFCGADEKKPFIVTFLYASGERGRKKLFGPLRSSLLQIYLYRFEEEKRLMIPLAAVTPRGEGTTVPWVDTTTGRLFVFQGSLLTVQEGWGFPDYYEFEEATDVLFASPSNETSLYILSNKSGRIRGKYRSTAIHIQH